MVWLEAEVARIWCPNCLRVRTEDVPWARPNARHSWVFEDTVAWLATRDGCPEPGPLADALARWFGLVLV